MAIFSDSSLDIIGTLLGAGLFLANIAVWRGVYLEHDRFPKEIQDKGWRLLIKGLAAETMIALLSMTIDTISSNRQNEKIASLYLRATKAENDTARITNDTEKLSKETAIAKERAANAETELEKYKAPRSLKSEQRSRIIEQMRHVEPQTFDVSASGDPESLAFAAVIEDVLTSAGWVQVEWKYTSEAGFGLGFKNIGPNGLFIGNVNVPGLQIRMKSEYSVEFLPIAEMLAHELRNDGIDAVALDIDETQSDNDGAIHILVGKKP